MSSLKPYQLVNHFKEARHITTKSGLLRTLRMLPWYAPYSSDGYVPLDVQLPHAFSCAGSVSSSSSMMGFLGSLTRCMPAGMSCSFFPRCHDLHETGGVDGFEVDFKCAPLQRHRVVCATASSTHHHTPPPHTTSDRARRVIGHPRVCSRA